MKREIVSRDSTRRASSFLLALKSTHPSSLHPHPLSSDPILVSLDGPIATVVLNNPGRLNALTKAMWTRLGTAMSELSANEALRCVVLRGAGDRAFAAGADIAEFATERADARQAKAYGGIIH